MMLVEEESGAVDKQRRCSGSYELGGIGGWKEKTKCDSRCNSGDGCKSRASYGVQMLKTDDQGISNGEAF